MSSSFEARAPLTAASPSVSAPPSRLLHTAHQLARCVVEGDQAAICLVCGLDKPQGRMRLLSTVGFETPAQCLCTQPSDETVDAALHGRVGWTEALSALPEAHVCAALRAAKAVSRLALPLTGDRATLGVVQVASLDPHHYLPQEIEPMQKLGKWWAAALENARLLDRASSLFGLANTLSTTMELKAVGNVIAEQVAKAMGVKGCSLRSLDRVDLRLELIGSSGLSNTYLTEKGPVVAGENVADILEGKPAVIRDVTTDPRMQYPEAAVAEGIASMVTVPMVVKGVVTGVLRVYTAEPYDFGEEEMAFLAAAAGVAGAAVENARIYDGIQADFKVLLDEIVFMRKAAKAARGSKVW